MFFFESLKKSIFFLQIIGFCIGVITPIRKLMVGNDAPFHVAEDFAAMLGYASQNLIFKSQDIKAKSCVYRVLSFLNIIICKSIIGSEPDKKFLIHHLLLSILL